MTDMLIHADTALPDAPSWTDDLDGYLTCTGIVDVTHDVKTFELELPGPAPLRFLPGQYLTFRLLVDGERVERCYTISSAPTRPDRMTITVKRVPGGTVSNWLHDHLRVGDAIGASGPLGRFSTALHRSDKYLFLTAGSGITPALSMLRTLCDTRDPASVVFVHCARTPDDIIYRHELEMLAAEHGVRLAIVCEDDSRAERWDGPRGRLSTETLLRVAPDLLAREVFTCGPGPYMEAVRTMLADLGADPARCHEESFVLGAARAIEEPARATGTTYQVELARTGTVVECDAGTTILEAAAQAGVALPSSCGEGVCGTCKLTKLSGEVDMEHGGGIRPREIRENKILACCSTPLGDVVVDA